MNIETVKKLVDTQITKTIGCTDIGVVGYIASIGAYILRHQTIQSIHLIMSDELYKNSVNVGVPGIKRSGLNQALALGVLLKNPSSQLSVFETVTGDDIEKVDALLKQIDVKIEHKKFEGIALYEELNMTTREGDQLQIIIKDHYDNVYKVIKNGEVLRAFEKDQLIEKVSRNRIQDFDDIFDFVDQGDFIGLEELFKIAELQYLSALEEVNLLHKRKNLINDHTMSVEALAMKLKTCIEVSSKKRMIGEIFTVYGVAGSGNLGIGTLITPHLIADFKNLNTLERQKLVVLSFLTSVYVKQEMNIVTVLCGTGHATGCSSAACYLYASHADKSLIKEGINLYLSSTMGFVCDGAKLSCSYKVSFAAMNGMIAGQMVLDQSHTCDGLGINKMDVDQTIRNLGKLNNEILDSANKGIISLI